MRRCSVPIKVLVRDVPQLVRDMVEHAIESQSDMVLLDDRSRVRPSPGVALTPPVAPDAVIVGTTAASRSHGVPAAWSEWPDVPVVLVTLDGRDAVLYELAIKTAALGEQSPSELVDVIRSAVSRSRRSKL
jgi:DNA-binding NarL/FixJ family response regulator